MVNSLVAVCSARGERELKRDSQPGRAGQGGTRSTPLGSRCGRRRHRRAPARSWDWRPTPAPSRSARPPQAGVLPAGTPRHGPLGSHREAGPSCLCDATSPKHRLAVHGGQHAPVGAEGKAGGAAGVPDQRGVKLAAATNGRQHDLAFLAAGGEHAAIRGEGDHGSIGHAHPRRVTAMTNSASAGLGDLAAPAPEHVPFRPSGLRLLVPGAPVANLTRV